MAPAYGLLSAPWLRHLQMLAVHLLDPPDHIWGPACQADAAQHWLMSHTFGLSHQVLGLQVS
jgi:hypothetical protein